LLVAARKTWLLDALRSALSQVDPELLKEQIIEYVPLDAQQILAAAGIRDEHVFPTPVVLKTAPTLVGYYRLLLGAPQKSFYGDSTRLAKFKSMEVRGIVNDRQRSNLPAFCKAMSKELAELVRQMSPTITFRDVTELPLLTIGSQFQGGNNVLIGKRAIVDVFLSIRAVLREHITADKEKTLTVTNSAGRKVFIVIGSDPDVRIEEEIGGKIQKRVAIEIKGGTDRSNAHNRAGEAEKSHQKAKGQGFRDFWTIIAKKGLSIAKLQRESPTTNSWFDTAQVLAREGDDWQEFKNRLAGHVGIPLG